MASQTKKQAWYLGLAAVLASALGAAVDAKLIPHPWEGLAVAVGMFLGTIIRPPAPEPAPAGQLDMAVLIAELDKRRRRSTTPPQPMPPVEPPKG